MRQDSEDVLDVQNGLGFREFNGWHHGPHGSVVFLKGFSGFSVGSVTGFDGDDMPVELAAREHEVADDVKCLVSCEFVVKTHGLLGHDFIAPYDDGIFKRAPFDESFVEEGFDVFVEGEGAGGSDFLFVNLRGDDGGEVLHEAAVLSDVGDRDAELFIWNDGNEASVPGFEMDGFADFPDFPGDGLLLNPCFFNKLDEGGGGSIANRWLIGIHFDEGVVDSHANES